VELVEGAACGVVVAAVVETVGKRVVLVVVNATVVDTAVLVPASRVVAVSLDCSGVVAAGGAAAAAAALPGSIGATGAVLDGRTGAARVVVGALSVILALLRVVVWVTGAAVVVWVPDAALWVVVAVCWVVVGVAPLVARVVARGSGASTPAGDPPGRPAVARLPTDWRCEPLLAMRMAIRLSSRLSWGCRRALRCSPR